MSLPLPHPCIDDSHSDLLKLACDVAGSVIESFVVAFESIADPDTQKSELIAFLDWLTVEIEEWRAVAELPPDVTGNPWPDCICNDRRYEIGHMEDCPAFGRTPDMPTEEEA